MTYHESSSSTVGSFNPWSIVYVLQALTLKNCVRPTQRIYVFCTTSEQRVMFLWRALSRRSLYKRHWVCSVRKWHPLLPPRNFFFSFRPQATLCGTVVDKEVPDHVFLQILTFPPLSIIIPILHIKFHSPEHHVRYITLATDSIVKHSTSLNVIHQLMH
jgi:hypothetical protein